MLDQQYYQLLAEIRKNRADIHTLQLAIHENANRLQGLLEGIEDLQGSVKKIEDYAYATMRQTGDE